MGPLRGRSGRAVRAPAGYTRRRRHAGAARRGRRGRGGSAPRGLAQGRAAKPRDRREFGESSCFDVVVSFAAACTNADVRGLYCEQAFREATLLADHIEARVERGAGDSEAAAALNAAVDSYGREARAEAAAMVRLAQAGTGWPGLARLQRKQRPWLTQALQLLHVANIRWRFKLAKLPLVGERIFFPQLVMMMHRTGPPYNLSYRSILRKVDRTTLAIRVGLVGVFSGVASLLVLAGKFVAAWVGVAM
jgi:hypothetical protein